MKPVAVLSICLFLLLPSGARAAFMTSGELSQRCLSDAPVDIRSCTDYIAGIIDYHMLMQSLGTVPTMDFCLPPEISKQQAAVLVMAYLEGAPQHNDFTAAAAVPLALNKAFPCARKKG